MESYLSDGFSISQVDLPRQFASQLRIMCDHDEGNAFDLIDFLEKIEDGLPCLRIQVTGGFVSKQNFRLQNQGPRYGNPLLFSSRELSGFVGKTVF
jgi:hypothetical protein